MYGTVNSALPHHSLHLLEAGTASFALLFSSERCLLGLLRRRGTPSAAAAASPVAWRADRRPALPAATAASTAAGCRGACGTRAAFAAAAVAWRAALRGREPERILFPCADKQQHHTAAPCPLKVRCRVPSLASHGFKDSREPERILFPSGEKRQRQTATHTHTHIPQKLPRRRDRSDAWPLVVHGRLQSFGKGERGGAGDIGAGVVKQAMKPHGPMGEQEEE